MSRKSSERKDIGKEKIRDIDRLKSILNKKRHKLKKAKSSADKILKKRMDSMEKREIKAPFLLRIVDGYVDACMANALYGIPKIEEEIKKLEEEIKKEEAK